MMRLLWVVVFLRERFAKEKERELFFASSFSNDIMCLFLRDFEFFLLLFQGRDFL